MFYITVSNGILDGKHRKKMQVNQKTSAIWVYLWLLDKMTKIDLETGLGKVLGGKPIKVEEDLKEFGDRKTVMGILRKLEEGGYIKTTRTPYGKSISVTKAKKSFGWQPERSPKSGTSQNQESGTSEDENLVHLGKESGTSNKTIQLDNTEDNIILHSEQSSPDINKVISLFKDINPSYRKWYANKTQRSAIDRLIKTIGLEAIEKAVSFLPRTNKMQYAPTIHSPLELEERVAKLKDFIIKHGLQKPNVVKIR